MDADVDGRHPGAEPPAHAEPWRALDRSLPWLMAGLAVVFAVVAFGLMEPLRQSTPRVVGTLFAVVALLWAGLAAAACTLAFQHARATPRDRLLPRLAWCWVPVVFVVGLPIALFLASDQLDDDYSPPRVCVDALLPASVGDVLFGWIPEGPYPWAHVVVGVAGLAMMGPASTRRPAAWVPCRDAAERVAAVRRRDHGHQPMRLGWRSQARNGRRIGRRGEGKRFVLSRTT